MAEDRRDGERVDSQAAPGPVGPYPHARREGEWLFLSGVGPRARGTDVIPGVTRGADGAVVDHDIVVQTRACIENLRAVLEASGSRLEDVVDVVCFLTDMDRDFAGFNQVDGEYFGEIRPTRTTLGVTALPTPIAVELECVARVRAAGE